MEFLALPAQWFSTGPGLDPSCECLLRFFFSPSLFCEYIQLSSVYNYSNYTLSFASTPNDWSLLFFFQCIHHLSKIPYQLIGW